MDVGPVYAASKAALNVIVAKFSAEYKKEGILFLSVSPGLVEVGRYDNGTYLTQYIPSSGGDASVVYLLVMD